MSNRRKWYGGHPNIPDTLDDRFGRINSETGAGTWIGRQGQIEYQLMPEGFGGTYSTDQAEALAARLAANPVPTKYALSSYGPRLWKERVTFHGYTADTSALDDLPAQQNKPTNPGVKNVTFSTYGTVVPISAGQRRLYGNVIDCTPLVPQLVGTRTKTIPVEIPFYANDSECGPIIGGSGNPGGGADSTDDDCTTRKPNVNDVPQYAPDPDPVVPPPDPDPDPDPEGVTFVAGGGGDSISEIYGYDRTSFTMGYIPAGATDTFPEGWKLMRLDSYRRLSGPDGSNPAEEMYLELQGDVRDDVLGKTFYINGSAVGKFIGEEIFEDDTTRGTRNRLTFGGGNTRLRLIRGALPPAGTFIYEIVYDETYTVEII